MRISMKQLFVCRLAVIISVIALSKAQTIDQTFETIIAHDNPKLTLDNVCDEFDITMRVTQKPRSDQLVGDKPFMVKLYRLCNSTRTIDLLEQSQNLTFFYDLNSAFFNGLEHADHFIGVQVDTDNSDHGVYFPVTLTKQIELTPEEIEKYNAYQVQIDKRDDDEVHEIVAKALYPGRKEWDEIIRLTPGWKGKLRNREIIKQVAFSIYIETGGSDFDNRTVSVMAGWFNVPPSSGRRTIVTTELWREYITIFFNPPDLPDRSIFPDHVVAKLNNEQAWGETFDNVKVSLYPGWFGELHSSMKQKFVPDLESGLKTLESVTVYPKYRPLKQGEGYHATVDLGYEHQIITIVF